MTKNELLYIISIAEHQNLSQAAADLYIAQPSLTQALQKVEQEFGTPNFLRSGDGMILTPFGERYVQTARAILKRYQQFLGELDEFHEMKKGKICFGIPQNLGTYLLPNILPEFIEQYPGIQIDYREINSVSMNRQLMSGKLDFCIMHFQEQQNGIVYEHLAADPFYLVTPAAHPLAKKHEKFQLTGLQLEDLKQYEHDYFIAIDKRQALREMADHICEKADLHPDIRFTTKSMETAKRLVAAGMGNTFLPRSFLNLFSNTEGLVCYPLCEELHAQWEMVLASQESVTLSRAVRSFVNLLKKEC